MVLKFHVYPGGGLKNTMPEAHNNDFNSVGLLYSWTLVHFKNSARYINVMCDQEHLEARSDIKFSKGGSWTSDVSLPWERFGDPNPWALPKTN